MIQRCRAHSEYQVGFSSRSRVETAQTNGPLLLQSQAPLYQSEVSGQAFVEACLDLTFHMVECSVNLEIFMNYFESIAKQVQLVHGGKKWLFDLSLLFFFKN